MVHHMKTLDLANSACGAMWDQLGVLCFISLCHYSNDAAFQARDDHDMTEFKDHLVSEARFVSAKSVMLGLNLDDQSQI